ncbi:MAG: DUF2950 domain-containing protein [Gammaproteobacteria bacterium]|nr:DUF2950 domain-containing protein [Gammaproteobacteria bacterium]
MTKTVLKSFFIIYSIISFAILGLSCTRSQSTFSTPEQAVQAFSKALADKGNQPLIDLFGSESGDIVSSGDEVADQKIRSQMITGFKIKHKLIKGGENHMILTIGESDWPLPIPLKKVNNRWLFDITEGKEEILNRRIGENEIFAFNTLLAIVDAQYEYAEKDRKANGIREYAQKFISTEGHHDGLYWPVKNGQQPSPIGRLLANAESQGYRDPTKPYHGYFFKLLKQQGSHAEGGQYDYLVRERMIGGFAVLAYPAKYNSSGIMTFITNHNGVVFEKDLGKDTHEKIEKISSFDPEPEWKAVVQEVTSVTKTN